MELVVIEVVLIVPEVVLWELRWGGGFFHVVQDSVCRSSVPLSDKSSRGPVGGSSGHHGSFRFQRLSQIL